MHYRLHKIWVLIRFQSLRMWHYVSISVSPSGLKDHSAFILQSSSPRQHWRWRHTMILLTTESYLSNDMMSHPKQWNCHYKLLLKIHNLHKIGCHHSHTHIHMPHFILYKLSNWYNAIKERKNFIFIQPTSHFIPRKLPEFLVFLYSTSLCTTW
jgi:hypothetical protein